MNYKKIKEKENKMKFEIEISKEEWNEELENSYEKNKGKYKVQGFRNGHAPRKIIEQNYGEYVFFDSALDNAFYKYFYEVLQKEKDVEIIGSPALNVKKMDETGLTLEVICTLKPEVKLGEYKNLTIEKDKISVSKEEIDAEMELLKDQQSRMVEVERKSQNGDTLNINFEGFVDGKPFEGGKAEKFDLVLGSKSFIDNFEQQLEGTVKGEEKDVVVKFPDDYHAENLKGKQATFKVLVNEVRVKEIPELTNELIKNISEFESLKEYEKDVKEKLLKNKEAEQKTKQETKLVDKISDNATVVVPKIMVDEQVDAMIENMKQRMQYQGLQFEDYLKYINSNLEDFKKSQRIEAEKIVKTRLVLEAIVKAEKIEVSEKDLKEKIEEIAKKQNKTFDEINKLLNDHYKEHMLNDLLVDKLLNFLTENNNI